MDALRLWSVLLAWTLHGASAEPRGDLQAAQGNSQATPAAWNGMAGGLPLIGRPLAPPARWLKLRFAHSPELGAFADAARATRPTVQLRRRLSPLLLAPHLAVLYHLGGETARAPREYSGSDTFSTSSLSRMGRDSRYRYTPTWSSLARTSPTTAGTTKSWASMGRCMMSGAARGAAGHHHLGQVHSASVTDQDFGLGRSPPSWLGGLLRLRRGGWDVRPSCCTCRLAARVTHVGPTCPRNVGRFPASFRTTGRDTSRDGDLTPLHPDLLQLYHYIKWRHLHVDHQPVCDMAPLDRSSSYDGMDHTLRHRSNKEAIMFKLWSNKWVSAISWLCFGRGFLAGSAVISFGTVLGQKSSSSKWGNGQGLLGHNYFLEIIVCKSACCIVSDSRRSAIKLSWVYNFSTCFLASLLTSFAAISRR